MIFKKDNQHFVSQQKLIDACKNNNRKAQLKLYDLYYKAMYSVSVTMVKDRHLAEDLMQEAFLSAFSNLNSFKGEVSFGAWLKKIVINKCIDYLKKKKVEFESIDNLSEIQIPSTEDESYIIDKKVNEIKSEINNLPDGYRTILSLYLFEGYDHEEIAQILRISSSTSRSQYTRAKALLVKNMKELK
jgi:RNA polymerase sigma factor (sigma-70 family)